MTKIILAGGSGFIGRRLTNYLINGGYKVTVLSRRPGKYSGTKEQTKYAAWDPAKLQLDNRLLNEAELVVNLAGANVGDKRWTKSYKKEIMSSRINSTRTLVNALNALGDNSPKLINISAIGYYGARDEIRNEDDPAGDDFMAEVCKQWEAEAFKLISHDNLLILRMGIVLGKDDGLLPKLAKPVKYGLGAPLGSGKQIIPWIHIEEVCRIIGFSIEQRLKGVYNAVAPAPVSNNELTRTIAKTLNRPYFLPPVPAFMIKLMLGEFAESVLGSYNISSRKIETSGFEFKYPEINTAICELLGD